MYWNVPDKNVRVLGSMHNFPADSPELPDWAMQAFEWAEELVMEVDDSDFLSRTRAPSPLNHRQSLRVATWRTLKGFWPHDSETIPPLEMVKPWAVELMRGSLSQPRALGVEPLFKELARDQKKPISFLETLDELVTPLEQIPQRAVYRALEIGVADASAHQQYLEMHGSWLRGDIASVHEIASNSPAFQFTELRHALIDRRNEEWAPRLKSLAESQSRRTLVVVGVLHLHGEGNLFDHAGLRPELIEV